MPRPAVIPNPDSSIYLKRGFDQMADVLALTLGPSKGSVLSWSDVKERPEMLHDSATIARRIIQIPDRRQDVGAMMLRQMVWQLHQRLGDGGATAAVLARAILNEGSRMITAGAVPVFVQHGIEKGTKMAVDQIKALSQPSSGEDDLIEVAEAVTGHEQLAFMLGEMFDILGEQAHITVERYLAPHLDRIYIEGGRWEAKIASPYFMTAEASKRAVLKDCQVVLYDTNLRSSAGLPEMLELVAQQKEKHLLFVVNAMDDEQIALLSHTHHDKNNEVRIVPSLLNIGGHQGRIELSDLAVLTGATVLGEAFGRPLEGIKKSDLGFARRVEADKENLFVIQGSGKPADIRAEIEHLQNRINTLEPDDDEIPDLEKRLARFSGSAGILQIGAHHKSEREVLFEQAQHGIRALKATLQEGYLPGGGVTYLRVAEAIDLSLAANEDERLGMLALKQALSHPFTQILTNAGIEAPALYAERLLAQGSNVVFDVISKRLTTAAEAGVLDPTRILREALESASSCAIMALSIDTTVLKKKPRFRRNVDP
ncbi:MAG: TCP-1/cpn60 chaperonin family protein [Chloroflexota bacterium]